MRIVAVTALVACLIPLVISCGDEEATPCCPESGCLQIHGPSYHCVGGEKPGLYFPPDPPSLVDGTVTIRWAEGTPASGTYELALDGSDFTFLQARFERERPPLDDGGEDGDGGSEAGDASSSPSQVVRERVAWVQWSGVDKAPSGEITALRGGARLCAAEDDVIDHDPAYREWESRAWRCVSPAGHEQALREIALQSTSIRTVDLGGRYRRTSISFAANDGSLEGAIVLEWSEEHREPSVYEPYRCADY